MTKILGDNIQTNIQKNCGNDIQSLEALPWRQTWYIKKMKINFECNNYKVINVWSLDNIWNGDSLSVTKVGRNLCDERVLILKCT